MNYDYSDSQTLPIEYDRTLPDIPFNVIVLSPEPFTKVCVSFPKYLNKE